MRSVAGTTRYLIELLLPLPTLLLLASVEDPFTAEAAKCGNASAMSAQVGHHDLTPTIPVIPAPQATPQQLRYGSHHIRAKHAPIQLEADT